MMNGWEKLEKYQRWKKKKEKMSGRQENEKKEINERGKEIAVNKSKSR